jgi:ABC-type protease/lipase transport system fused ATPase/permease subunit
MLLMMNQGRAQAFGPKEEVLSRVLQRDGAAASRSLKVVPEAGVAKS